MRTSIIVLFIIRSFTLQAQDHSDYWFSNDIARNVAEELEWAMQRQTFTNAFNLEYLMQLGQMFKSLKDNPYDINRGNMYWRKKNDELIGHFIKTAEIEKAAVSFSELGQSFFDAKKYYLAAQCLNSSIELTNKLPMEGVEPGEIVSNQYLVSLSLFNAGDANAALTFLLMNDTKANLYKIPDSGFRQSAREVIFKIEMLGNVVEPGNGEKKGVRSCVNGHQYPPTSAYHSCPQCGKPIE